MCIPYWYYRCSPGYNPVMAPTAPSRLTMPRWPVFAQDEIDAVVRVLESGKVNYWTGQEGREFEREFADFVGTRRAIPIANGTVTLELALIALGIGAGDEVIVTPRTFMATATAVMVRGAKPVFADVDPVSGNITAESISRVITPQTRAIIPVHLGGWPCEMDEMNSLGIPIIEDCAQAHGARYRGRSVGSLGTIGSWSFCQDKIMTLGGEGGAVTTDDEGLWDSMWSYKDHGKTFEAVYEREHAPGFRWVNDRLGTNWRLTEMQSAIARVQLRKLPEWVRQRQANAAVLNNRFVGNPMLSVPLAPAYMEHAYYRWHAYLDLESLRDGWSRERICGRMTELGVWCQVGSCSEIYLERVFDGTGIRPAERLPNARLLGETSLALRVDPALTTEFMEQVADTLESVLSEAKR